MTELKAVRSESIVTPEGVRPGVVLIDEGKITAIVEHGNPINRGNAIDVGRLFVLPGLIDPHVHINEPGRTEWEGFATATRAGAAGGYTCLVDMPLNSIPSTTTIAALDCKRRAAQGKAFIDLAFWGAAVPDNVQELIPLAKAGIKGFKCFLTHPGTDEFEMVSEQDLRSAMPQIAETKLPLLAHAELPGPVDKASCELDVEAADWTRYSTYLRSRPPSAELEAIRLLIDLCRLYRCRLHIVHLSTAAALPELLAARAEGLPLTVETCPHYLFFASESIPKGATEFKCAPPIRDDCNREALWDGLRAGIIDLIATDHSPCPPALKCFNTGSFRTAWGGISSLSLAFPAVWTEACRRGISIDHVVRWMAAAPARLAGIESRKGGIAPGLDADLVIFDPDTEWEVNAGNVYFRHACTPYLGQRLRGKIQQTFVRGRLCFDRGEINDKPFGREVI